MRYLYTLVFGLLLAWNVQAESFRGFLLTKDNYQLTGYFSVYEYGPMGAIIEFTNDFGDVYSILPQLVKGFGFNRQGRAYRFISRFHEGQWFFLSEVVTGRALSLYQLPDGSEDWVDDTMLRLFSNPPPTYYFLYGKGQVFGVPRAGFKRTVRDFFAERSPGLATKIGKRGYRYKDLADIVVEFNERRGRRRL